VAFAAFGTVAAIWRLWPGVIREPFDGAGAWAEVVTVVLLVVVVAHLVAHAIKAPVQLPEPLATRVLARRYEGLNENQKQLLRSTFRRGSRQFEMHQINMRWFEELKDLGFIEYVDELIIVPGTPTPYEVTVRAWKALEWLSAKGRL
jgi:hypothetical protein